MYLPQELYVEQVYADWEEQAAYLHDFMHATNPWQFFNAINGLNSYRSPYILPLPKKLFGRNVNKAFIT